VTDQTPGPSEQPRAADQTPRPPDRPRAADQPLRPAHFARSLVAAVEASDGRRRRRKRDTEPDRIGLDIKRDLLAGTAAEDPDPEQFEGFLLGRALAAEASGPVRAICLEILDEYLLARADSAFASWLAAGAPSEDAYPDDGGQRRARRS
jgi:hypothetical protein